MFYNGILGLPALSMLLKRLLVTVTVSRVAMHLSLLEIKSGYLKTCPQLNNNKIQSLLLLYAAFESRIETY